MSWAGSVADKSKNIWNKTTDALAEKGDFVTAEGKKAWDKTSNILCETKNSVTEGSIDVVEKIRLWLIFVLVKAIHSCSAEQERLEVLSWLALVREIIANPSNSFQSKAKDIYHRFSQILTVIWG